MVHFQDSWPERKLSIHPFLLRVDSWALPAWFPHVLGISSLTIFKVGPPDWGAPRLGGSSPRELAVEITPATLVMNQVIAGVTWSILQVQPPLIISYPWLAAINHYKVVSPNRDNLVIKLFDKPVLLLSTNSQPISSTKLTRMSWSQTYAMT